MNRVNVDGEGHLQQLRNYHTLVLICHVFSDTHAVLLETFVLLSASPSRKRRLADYQINPTSTTELFLFYSLRYHCFHANKSVLYQAAK